jgi:hypothetical protein
MRAGPSAWPECPRSARRQPPPCGRRSTGTSFLPADLRSFSWHSGRGACCLRAQVPSHATPSGRSCGTGEAGLATGLRPRGRPVPLSRGGFARPGCGRATRRSRARPAGAPGRGPPTTLRSGGRAARPRACRARPRGPRAGRRARTRAGPGSGPSARIAPVVEVRFGRAPDRRAQPRTRSRERARASPTTSSAVARSVKVEAAAIPFSRPSRSRRSGGREEVLLVSPLTGTLTRRSIVACTRSPFARRRPG